jgi:hypothetical protein
MTSPNGSINTVLVSNCKNLFNLSVTLQVTQDLVTLANTGFSLQLNCYPQITSKAQGTPETGDSTLTWFQYILIVANNQVTYEIQYWANNAYSYVPHWTSPSQWWPPGYTPNPPNTSPWLPVFPGNAITGTVATSMPSNQVPAGSVITIQLATDANGNVTGATFGITDPSGAVHQASTKPWPEYAGVPEPPQYALYPIYGFQLDLVGTPGSSCTFISGAGTLIYSIYLNALAIQDASTACGGSQPGTAESSNIAYGALIPGAGPQVSQTLSVGWAPWFLVHNEVKMQPGATVTALWRSNDTHLDLFATGNDGAVWTTWWESGPGWQPWFLVHNEVKMQPGAMVTALWRSNDTHLDLFATGNDGAVWTTWWESSPGWQPWFLVHSGIKMQPGATVTALWRSNETYLDLFASGNDGTVWSTWFEARPGWQPWFVIQPEVKMQLGTTVTALSRSNDTHLDLFATGNDGAVWTTWQGA